MNFMKTCVVATVATLLASTAIAEEGWYLGLGGGWNNVHDDRVKGSGFNNQIEYDDGFAVQGSLGYAYTNGLRSELELGYRSNDVDTISTVRATGDTSVYSAMLNVLYDFDISDTGLDTYVGLGAGLAHIDYDNVSPVNGVRLDDTDTTPALQAIVGATYDIGNATELFVDYRYFHATNPDFKNSAGVATKTDYDASTVMAGLKFNLYDSEPRHAPIVEPVPAPEPMVKKVTPAPEPEQEPMPVSRTYIVFFDWDRSEITNEAMSIIRQAAVDAQSGNAVAIQVIGHADRSGSANYNLGLSKRRAGAVENALANLGVDIQRIETDARGESDPLVPTADGVREPQNRRAEIMYVLNPN